jgi:poly-gamma-glutamate capsule biosynthesis protein CapA/YwtB (metallophosphatase superfamily)
MNGLLRTLGLLASLTVIPVALGCGQQSDAPLQSTSTPAARTPEATPTTADETISVIFTGDIIPARCVYARQLSEGDFTFAFRRIGPWLAAADLAVGSLDASLSDAGQPIGCTPTFNLLAPPRSVAGLVYAGFDVLTVATNHVKDCGGRGTTACDEALQDTIGNLRAAGIATTGAGANTAEARDPAIVTVKGVRFAFLGYDDIASYYNATESAPGTAPLTTATLVEDVRRARQQADVVVVLPHWGVEYTVEPTQRQRDLARAAIDAGATLVVGNHPHSVQAVDDLGKAYVAYSLGNFLFDQDWSLETQESVLLAATFQGPRLVATQLIPVRIGEGYRPALAPPEEAAQMLERIASASRVGP